MWTELKPLAGVVVYYSSQYETNVALWCSYGNYTVLYSREVANALCGFQYRLCSQYSGNHLMDYGSLRFDMGYASAIATILFWL